MIRLVVNAPGSAPGRDVLCTETPDAPSDESSRWSIACHRAPGHEPPHEAPDPTGSLDSTVRW